MSINQILKIPNKTTTNYITYTVVKGDNLYNIARKYNLSVEEIMRFNNLTNNLLSIGQILKIPSDNNELTYIVKSGDTLYAIAKLYNTTVDDIKRKNNLTNNILSVGQQLII